MAAETPLLLDQAAMQARLADLAQVLLARGWMMATAESCTGGLIAALCTSLAGSSEWFERGFVTYSNAAKTEQLGVPETLITRWGAVSQEVAEAMAVGALTHSRARVSVAVTGIAGPGGAVPGKPVGTVWLAWAQRDGKTGAGIAVQSGVLSLPGDRTAVRSATVRAALDRLLALGRDEVAA